MFLAKICIITWPIIVYAFKTFIFCICASFYLLYEFRYLSYSTQHKFFELIVNIIADLTEPFSSYSEKHLGNLYEELPINKFWYHSYIGHIVYVCARAGVHSIYSNSVNMLTCLKMW